MRPRGAPAASRSAAPASHAAGRAGRGAPTRPTAAAEAARSGTAASASLRQADAPTHRRPAWRASVASRGRRRHTSAAASRRYACTHCRDRSIARRPADWPPRRGRRRRARLVPARVARAGLPRVLQRSGVVAQLQPGGRPVAVQHSARARVAAQAQRRCVGCLRGRKVACRVRSKAWVHCKSGRAVPLASGARGAPCKKAALPSAFLSRTGHATIALELRCSRPARPLGRCA